MSFRIDSSNKTSMTRPTPPATSGGGFFHQTLDHVQKLQRQELDAFLKKVDAQAAKLETSLSVRDLTIFRDMIKKFLRSTFGLSHSLEEEPCWDFYDRPKVMSRITKIDQALDDLGRQLLEDQSKTLDILTKIDEIRGLLVDLFA
ncbi:MAG: YaaR family protein [Peptococcaceae bacterium]|jgi:uncharacterized protein YaaR (DUF327 family)|nr:YaaR family protein [Peptococcaceae bacterium]